MTTDTNTDTNPVNLRIDFVSDVACPWCAVGLGGLRKALSELDGSINAEVHLQPFELAPDMPREGENATAHLMGKYQINAARVAEIRSAIRERGAAVGFDYAVNDTSHVWNTFDAHRLLHWAEERKLEKILDLKQALFAAYFTHDENVANHAVLARIAGEQGYDAQAAEAMLTSDSYAEDVRRQEQYYMDAGIHSVPAAIVNNRHLISGGQPPEAYVSALRQIASGKA